MRRRFIAALSTLLLLGGATKAFAFSMLGPFAAWMTSDIGYNLPFVTNARVGDVGGPMNLGEEYRWNSPVITYSFDRSFEDYFGTEGIEAVEKAIAILNDLPRVSEMSEDLSEFPLSVARINNTATELRLMDIKTMVLSVLLEHMGLTSPERYTWTLRARRPTAVPEIFTYAVVQRNFDPVSYEPTTYVNGTRYTYTLFHDPTYSEAVEIELDPSIPNVSVAGISGIQAGNLWAVSRHQRIFQSLGLYVNGISRDDAGGLRYLYHPSNVNVENPPYDAVGDSAGEFAPGGSSTQDNSPWGLPGGVFGGLTNATAVAGTANTNSTFIFQGPRPGVDKIVFKRIPRSTGTNQAFFVRYQESIINESNGRLTRRVQTVTRVVSTPDITFVASDLDVVGNVAVAYAYDRFPNYFNNSAIHSTSAESTVGPGTIGPGTASQGAITVAPRMEISLSKIGLWNFHISDTSEEDRILGFDYSRGFAWASFDGSTNAPVIFPKGTSIKEMERRIFGRK